MRGGHGIFWELLNVAKKIGSRGSGVSCILLHRFYHLNMKSSILAYLFPVDASAMKPFHIYHDMHFSWIIYDHIISWRYWCFSCFFGEFTFLQLHQLTDWTCWSPQVSLDPLLQMLGFQDDTGPLLKVPREEMERMALQFPGEWGVFKVLPNQSLQGGDRNQGRLHLDMCQRETQR